MKFLGQIHVDIEYEKNKEKMQILITERNDLTPLLGMDWLKDFNLTIRNIRLDENNQSEKKQLIEQFSELFKNNATIKDTEINIQLKPGHYPVKQKTRSIPLHLQEEVRKELEKLIKTGNLEKVKHVDEDSFVSPVVITVKKDNKNRIRFEKTKRQLYKSQSIHAKHGVVIEPIFERNYERPNKERNDLGKRSGLRIWPDEVVKRNKPTMRIRNYRETIQADTTDSKKSFYGLADIPPSSKRKSTEHYNSQHRLG